MKEGEEVVELASLEDLLKLRQDIGGGFNLGE